MSENVNVSVQSSTNKVGFFEKLSYGLGDLAGNIIFASMSAFIVFYYTDVIKVSAAAIGSIMLISRLLDGAVDIIMGIIVDRTKSKYGKARPWILRMSIPFGIAAVLLFSVPDIGDTAKLIYIFVTYNIVNIIFTSINIPYGVLGSLISQDQYDRSVLNIFRMIFAMFTNLAMVMITLPLVQALGGGPSGWTKAFLIFGVLATVLLLITFTFTKERAGTGVVEDETAKKDNVPIKEGLKGLLKNKYWLMLTGYGLANGISMAIAMGAGVYYASYILGNPNLTGTITMAVLIPMIIALFIMAPFIKKFGKRNMSIAGVILQIIGCIAIFFSPENIAVVLIGTALKGVGQAPSNGVGAAMLADTVEYGEWKTGNRTEGLIFSAQSYGGKAGGGIGGALIGWALAYGGYVGGAAVQSPDAIFAIKILFVGIPIIVGVIQILILTQYKLDKEYPSILQELEERKNLSV